MKKRLALAALLAAAPFAVSAQALSYTYVEGGYDQTTIDEEQYISIDETEVDGTYVRGSVEISNSFHLFGRYAKLTGEESISKLFLALRSLGQSYPVFCLSCTVSASCWQ